MPDAGYICEFDHSHCRGSDLSALGGITVARQCRNYTGLHSVFFIYFYMIRLCLKIRNMLDCVYAS